MASGFMLAPRDLPPQYRQWNRRWGAPFGRFLQRALRQIPFLRATVDSTPWLAGYFAFQFNNESRRFEYPWAFHATPLHPGMTALEIGGSLAGFQFVLDRCGLVVSNCDPGDAARGRGWPVAPESMARLNRLFGTRVTLHPCFLQDAHLPDNTFDRVFAISTLEHIPERELHALIAEIRRILKPGGCFVATVDLFLDLAPFTHRASNTFGANVDFAALVAGSGMTMVHGNVDELYNAPGFSAGRILRDLTRYLVGSYPVLIQTVVLQKPDQAER